MFCIKVLGSYHADIFQNGVYIFRWQPPPPPHVPSDFDGLPYSRVRGYPQICFHQNEHNGCKRDYLDARGRFVLRFGAIGDKPLGGGNHPLSTA